jgi:DNA-3-methyladenine glycosylase I
MRTDIIDVYKRIEETVRSLCVPKSQFDRGLAMFLEEYGSKRARTDDEYHWLMTCVGFYSGMNARTVSGRLASVREHLYGVHRVARYDERCIAQIMNNPRTIRNGAKISASIQNAKRFEAIAAQFGSFQRYVDTFETGKSFENLIRFRDSLRAQFKMLGPRTVYHFMMDIGLPVLKPDRVIVRIFRRLGILNEPAFDDDALLDNVNVGRQIALASGRSIRQVDLVLVLFGQVGGDDSFCLQKGVCLERKPHCGVCKVRESCEHFRNHRDLQTTTER